MPSKRAYTDSYVWLDLWEAPFGLPPTFAEFLAVYVPPFLPLVLALARGLRASSQRRKGPWMKR
jgi:hypothetical protein